MPYVYSSVWIFCHYVLVLVLYLLSCALFFPIHLSPPQSSSLSFLSSFSLSPLMYLYPLLPLPLSPHSSLLPLIPLPTRPSCLSSLFTLSCTLFLPLPPFPHAFPQKPSFLNPYYLIPLYGPSQLLSFSPLIALPAHLPSSPFPVTSLSPLICLFSHPSLL
jgi:hypothetical protein